MYLYQCKKKRFKLKAPTLSYFNLTEHDHWFGLRVKNGSYKIWDLIRICILYAHMPNENSPPLQLYQPSSPDIKLENACIERKDVSLCSAR